jgi:type III pantothenate kinase
MNFILDIGNTNVKAAIFDQNNLVVQKMVSLGDLGNVIDRMIEEHQPAHIIASSVSATKEELEILIDNRVEWFMFDASCTLPISVEYQSKETLGSDRLAGVMGVYNEYLNKNVLVIDAGTCITYDLLTYDNRYFGGAISPGCEMRYKSLNKFTKKLPLLTPKERPSLIGQSTEDAIHSGVVNGMSYEIDGVINAYKKRFGNLFVVMTGGDAKNFVNEVKNTTFADQNLILNGLNKILDYHYQKA